MIRLVAIVDTFDIGGFELACLDLLTRIDRSRFDPSILAFRPGALVDRARAAGIPVVVGYDKPSADTAWNQRDRRARTAWARRMGELMREANADVCMTWAWPEAITAARSAGVSAVVERVDGPALAARVADKSGCTRVIVESRTVRDTLLAQRDRLRLDARRVVVIPNGVDLERFDPDSQDQAASRKQLGIPRGSFVAGTIARLAPEKNLGQLVAAFAHAAQRSRAFARQAWLVLAGPDAGSEADLRGQAHALGVAERVIFPGAVVDQPGTLAAFDVFCITSYTEGSPAALLEAMAMARPVIATPVGALLELIDGNALIVDVLAPRATSEALRELFEDKELRATLGERSRSIARHWGVAKQVRSYESVLEEAFREASA